VKGTTSALLLPLRDTKRPKGEAAVSTDKSELHLPTCVSRDAQTTEIKFGTLFQRLGEKHVSLLLVYFYLPHTFLFVYPLPFPSHSSQKVHRRNTQF
jgi:hypothetical protein